MSRSWSQLEAVQRLERDRTLSLREQLRLVREIERGRREAARIPAAAPPGGGTPGDGGGGGGNVPGDAGGGQGDVYLDGEKVGVIVTAAQARSGIYNDAVT